MLYWGEERGGRCHSSLISEFRGQRTIETKEEDNAAGATCSVHQNKPLIGAFDNRISGLLEA